MPSGWCGGRPAESRSSRRSPACAPPTPRSRASAAPWPRPSAGPTAGPIASNASAGRCALPPGPAGSRGRGRPRPTTWMPTTAPSWLPNGRRPVRSCAGIWRPRPSARGSPTRPTRPAVWCAGCSSPTTCCAWKRPAPAAPPTVRSTERCSSPPCARPTCCSPTTPTACASLKPSGPHAGPVPPAAAQALRVLERGGAGYWGVNVQVRLWPSSSAAGSVTVRALR